MSHQYANRRPAILHLCRQCARLLGMQRGPSLFVKFKECEWVMEGRAELRCRCGLITVVVTVPITEEPTRDVPTAEARPPPLDACFASSSLSSVSTSEGDRPRPFTRSGTQ